MRRTVWAIGGAVTATAAAAVAFTLLTAPDAPEVDPRLRAEVAPAIRNHLETRHMTGGALTSEGRWFCSVHIIEFRHRGSDLLAGIDADCAQYARRGHGLVRGTASSTPTLVTLRTAPTGGRQVTNVRDGGKLNGDPYLTRTFTDEGKAQFLRIAQDGRPEGTEDPADLARLAYGLPPDAPVQDAAPHH